MRTNWIIVPYNISFVTICDTYRNRWEAICSKHVRSDRCNVNRWTESLVVTHLEFIEIEFEPKQFGWSALARLIALHRFCNYDNITIKCHKEIIIESSSELLWMIHCESIKRKHMWNAFHQTTRITHTCSFMWQKSIDTDILFNELFRTKSNFDQMDRFILDAVRCTFASTN